MLPRSGGPYAYLKEAYPPWWAFLRGWAMFFVSETASIAAVALVFAQYSAVMWTAAGGGAWPRGLETSLAVAGVWLFTWVNVRGVRTGGAGAERADGAEAGRAGGGRGRGAGDGARGGAGRGRGRRDGRERGRRRRRLGHRAGRRRGDALRVLRLQRLGGRDLRGRRGARARAQPAALDPLGHRRGAGHLPAGEPGLPAAAGTGRHGRLEAGRGRRHARGAGRPAAPC